MLKGPYHLVDTDRPTTPKSSIVNNGNTKSNNNNNNNNNNKDNINTSNKIKKLNGVANGVSSALVEDRTLRRDNVHFILSAEFDNKLGPKVKFQYPNSIPGFPSSLHGAHSLDSTINLASLMIPNNVEYTPGKKDFTVFMLYYNTSTKLYQLFKPSNIKTEVQKNDNDDNDDEENEDGDGDDDSEYIDSEIFTDAKDENDNLDDIDTLYFINVVNTVIDKNNDRGAVIKSISLGTTLKIFSIFRPVLSKLLVQYMNNSQNSLNILIDCFKMINSLDLSLINKIHSKKYAQLILGSIIEEKYQSKVLNPNNEEFKKIFKIKRLFTNDHFGNKISYENKYITYRFTNFRSNFLNKDILNQQLRIPIIADDSLGSYIIYNQKILRFLSKFYPFINKLTLQNFSWRLIINSTTFSKDELSHFILVLSNYVNSCFDCDATTYYKQNSILIFPYMDISMVDALRKYLNDKSGNISNKFAIIGVANPIFKYQQNLWDCYYDLDTETLYDSIEVIEKEKADLQLKNRPLQRNGSLSIRKILLKPADVIINTSKLSHQRNSLLLRCVKFLLTDDRDYNTSTITSVFKKVNLLQLVELLRRKTKTSSNSISLQDEYMAIYKDLILFPVFFEYSSLYLIELIINLHESIELLYSNDILPFQTIIIQLTNIKQILKKLYHDISYNRSNMERFLNLIYNLPSLKIFDNFNLQRHDFSANDLERSMEPLSQNNIYADMENRVKLLSSSWIEVFINSNVLPLFIIPLFFEPNCSSNIDLFTNSSRWSRRPSIGGKAKLPRSLSFKKLFPINSNPTAGVSASHVMSASHSSKNEEHSKIITPNSSPIIASPIPRTPNTNSGGPRITPNTSQSNTPTNGIELENLVNSCRKLSIQILYCMNKNALGELLLEKSSTTEIKNAYSNAKIEFNSTLVGDTNKKENEVKKSSHINRTDLMRELSLIAEREDEFMNLEISDRT
ncbi:hypothetical protein Kpol_440p5 [Vanderwaltozyma polyspora DSM 70294]|uniref:Arf3-interacting protein 1 N-terminal domain-containing protein n=1 Tax=Vanderwaltozyma polyspora (strain ATCC 22028 / DSM 70294 / BCRC 21397 / CBS 2163 / NBRC 10782 / NRRL Y-8283 / UCD 57-17) TaxID=436907 RepID=A7TRE4_VANPO|nr:uncharacterized protein Kpol_440p5 [Vanderwaltozyma polyspora DSM 70294]EDO15158.1 hypothetical protein Kpol_440p5 [Vanderwaltozyma polyspora DSM 70294]